MLLQVPNWDKAEDLSLGSKDLLITVLFAAVILFALAWVFRELHEREQRRKNKAS